MAPSSAAPAYGLWGSILYQPRIHSFVIPAQAGIHLPPMAFPSQQIDSRQRGNDEIDLERATFQIPTALGQRLIRR